MEGSTTFNLFVQLLTGSVRKEWANCYLDVATGTFVKTIMASLA